MVSIELNRNYKYNVIVGKTPGLQTVHYANGRVGLFFIKACAWVTGRNVKVYTAGINYVRQGQSSKRKTNSMG